MRILFYLPVITEWWFDTIMVNLVRAAARDAEVHIAVPPLWRLTGIGERQLQNCVDLTEIRWHILGGADHPSLRTRPADPQAVIDFVRGIDPDYVICRSADIETPAAFPGKVAYVMEGTIPPFSVPRRIKLCGPGLFDHGVLPPLDGAQQRALAEGVGPGWDRYRAANTPSAAERAAFFERTGLPPERKLIAMPLDYVGPDNFFPEVHGVGPDNDTLIAQLVDRLDDDFLLALNKHPIDRHVEFDRIEALIDRYPDRVRIVEDLEDDRNPAVTLLRHSEAMVLRDSKSFANCAVLGKPMLRLSRFATGDWMHAYDAVDPFLADLRAGTARAPDADQAQAWFGFHYANDAFSYVDPEMTLADLLARIDRPVDPDRWAAAFAACRAVMPNDFA